MFGHCADSQTVCRPRPRASFFRLCKFSPTGALALSHEGLGLGILGPRSIWMSWEAADIKSNFISSAETCAADYFLLLIGSCVFGTGRGFFCFGFLGGHSPVDPIVRGS